MRSGIPHPTLAHMTSRIPDPDIRIRLATLADVAALARHRVKMFRDMGELPRHLEAELTDASESFLRRTIAAGEYVAWVAVTGEDPERVIAGAGLWLRSALPRPMPTGIDQRREALVANVYTEPDWRRRGIAALLMRQVLDYTREHRILRVRLHASDEGRRLYESLGFAPSNEMKLVLPI
jgi:GNAT superfamily N-acetyltransferase